MGSRFPSNDPAELLTRSWPAPGCPHSTSSRFHFASGSGMSVTHHPLDVALQSRKWMCRGLDYEDGHAAFRA